MIFERQVKSRGAILERGHRNHPLRVILPRLNKITPLRALVRRLFGLNPACQDTQYLRQIASHTEHLVEVDRCT